MKAVIQRVSRASVTIIEPRTPERSGGPRFDLARDGEVSGAIERGLLVYLGVGRGDGERERDWMIDKILGLRIFPNDEGSPPSSGGAKQKMDKSVLDVGGKLLVVSQFTLYGDVKRGRRPSFDGAMPPAEAERAYESFVQTARARIAVETGRFGAHMLVDSINEGPVTILLDTSAS